MTFISGRGHCDNSHYAAYTIILLFQHGQPMKCCHLACRRFDFVQSNRRPSYPSLSTLVLLLRFECPLKLLWFARICRKFQGYNVRTIIREFYRSSEIDSNSVLIDTPDTRNLNISISPTITNHSIADRFSFTRSTVVVN